MTIGSTNVVRCLWDRLQCDGLLTCWMYQSAKLDFEFCQKKSLEQSFLITFGGRCSHLTVEIDELAA